jgi:hypothetical protein
MSSPSPKKLLHLPDFIAEISLEALPPISSISLHLSSVVEGDGNSGGPVAITSDRRLLGTASHNLGRSCPENGANRKKAQLSPY